MEDQAIKIVGEIDQGQFTLSTRQPDGADEEAEAVFLLAKDMFDLGADG